MPAAGRAERGRILGHANACARCARLIREAEAIRAALAPLGRPLEPPVGFAARVLRGVRPWGPEATAGDLAWHYARRTLPAGAGLALLLAGWTFLAAGNGRPVSVGQFLAQAEAPRDEAAVVFGGREPTLGQVLLSVVGAEGEARD
jgi:hypothetical protein